MQKYLFVSTEDSYTRDEVKPEEFKAVAAGDLAIFELDQEGGVVSKYDHHQDEFLEVRRTFS